MNSPDGTSQCLRYKDVLLNVVWTFDVFVSVRFSESGAITRQLLSTSLCVDLNDAMTYISPKSVSQDDNVYISDINGGVGSVKHTRMEL